MKPLQKENGYFVSMECWCEKCYNEKRNLEWGENWSKSIIGAACVILFWTFNAVIP